MEKIVFMIAFSSTFDPHISEGATLISKINGLCFWFFASLSFPVGN